MSRLRNIVDAQHLASVTPHDTNNLDYDSYLYVGGSGNLNVMTAHNEEVVLVGLSAGDVVPVKIRKVLNTSTTATSIVAIW